MKFKATDELRAQVKSLVGIGVSQQQICALIGLESVNTLRKHFRAELARGGVEALAKVQQTAFRLATSGRNPRMTMRWLNQRARWSPGLRSRPDPGRVAHHKWIIEEYQPPLADDDPRRSFSRSELPHNRQRPTWDGDQPGDDDDPDS